MWRVEFRSIFHATSQKFKILAIPDVLAHRKPYMHGFTKKCDGHKFWCDVARRSSFDRFVVYRLQNLKYWPFPMYCPMGSRINTIS
ncbi:hypothetical protein B296_00005286 [Ensete ventricosum]|uniref:Uncharacterized protein n=1 Tax=Ensete ventricosum TaxID=4639 RepID=A0A426YZU5_ENSVE|nr:hypothetical protein B296_00005286 [Ensete ventricosum]